MKLLARSAALATCLIVSSSWLGCASPPASEDEGSTTADGAAEAITASTTVGLERPGVPLGTFPSTLDGATGEWRLYGPRESDGRSLNNVSARLFDEDGKLLIAATFTIREKDGRFVGAGLNTRKGTSWTLDEVEEALVRDAKTALTAAEDDAAAAGGDVSTQAFGRYELNCIRASLMAVGIGGGAVLGASMGMAGAGGLACIPTMGAGCAVAAVGLLTATATLGAFSVDAYLSCTAPR